MANDEPTIYDLAMDLLLKYEDAEAANIRERSAAIDKDMQALASEIARYRAAIARLRATNGER